MENNFHEHTLPCCRISLIQQIVHIFHEIKIFIYNQLQKSWLTEEKVKIKQNAMSYTSDAAVGQVRVSHCAASPLLLTTSGNIWN